MKIKLNTFSRLTIIFILAVTIPGSILTYLSIQNITNLKELTEKKVLEEEEDLADLVYQNFQSKLNDISGEFTDYVSKVEESDYSSIRFSDTIDFIENPFIIDQNGKFLWPAFIADIVYKEETYSAKFIRSFNAAEKHEFIEQDYPRAKSQYLRSLSFASGKSDSAQSINAIARLHVKSKNYEQALKYYITLISKFYSVPDKNGLPYINYAIPQLINISDTNNTCLIYDRIQFVLSRMVSGKIPLNYSTDILIDEISGWINKNSSFIVGDIKETEEYINKIKNQISFLLINSIVIKDFVLKEKKKDVIPLMKDHYAISGTSNKNEESIIIKHGHDLNYISGFTINLEKLKQYSLNINIPFTFKFEYKIEIINNNINPIPLNGDLVIISKLSPLTPNSSLLIKLMNENVVKDYITRTSWIYGIAITLLLGGMILGVLLIIKDIYREKYLSKLRSDFVSNVTHELKTPLTSIYLFAESILLNRVKTKSDQKEYLGIILKETERLKRLINNILDFSKREKGKLDYNFSEVNISELVKSAINNLDYWIIEKKFIVKTKIEEDIIGYADPDALKQSIINLLSNAIKYSRDRKEIYVKLWKNEKLIYIEVKDKGIGIPVDQIDQIFNKFYRVENNNVTESRGTGLGLTVVKDIVEAHKGKILVESKIDHSSKFTIVLNLE
ncbi:MAG: HAMP domain-containing histidine kinase [Bacteroidales bacterium]|nr:HAMP domain-containing histidine kinase [Bacteroidales bacterium]